MARLLDGSSGSLVLSGTEYTFDLGWIISEGGGSNGGASFSIEVEQGGSWGGGFSETDFVKKLLDAAWNYINEEAVKPEGSTVSISARKMVGNYGQDSGFSYTHP